MPLTPGTTLGVYEVLAAIGAGGMGEVYLGEDTRLGRKVAIIVWRNESHRILAIARWRPMRAWASHDREPWERPIEFIGGG